MCTVQYVSIRKSCIFKMPGNRQERDVSKAAARGVGTQKYKRNLRK